MNKLLVHKNQELKKRLIRLYPLESLLYVRIHQETNFLIISFIITT
jgi:hypothetical protein